MAIPRRNILEHYAKRAFTGLSSVQLEEKVANFSRNSQFSGERAALSAVVRCDLNGYSEWCIKEKNNLRARVELLNEYFTQTMLEIFNHNGVYYRDEGDCIVVLFSDYFTAGAFSGVKSFCRRVSEQSYGKDHLTAKNTISVGQVVYYQKTHEQGSDEWSADGDPFIYAARMEAEAESKQILHFEKSDYDTHFATISGGNDGNWKTHEEAVRIPNLWLANGWKTLTKDCYTPPNKDSKPDAKSSAFSNLVATTRKPDPFEKRDGGKNA